MRKVSLYFILFFQFLLIISLVKGVYDTFESRSRIATLLTRRDDLKAKNVDLQQKMTEVNSPLYVEKVARDELHLSKPGETVVIVPTNQQTSLPVSSEKKEDKQKPNWQKWWDVVSGKID